MCPLNKSRRAENRKVSSLIPTLRLNKTLQTFQLNLSVIVMKVSLKHSVKKSAKFFPILKVGIILFMQELAEKQPPQARRVVQS